MPSSLDDNRHSSSYQNLRKFYEEEMEAGAAAAAAAGRNEESAGDPRPAPPAQRPYSATVAVSPIQPPPGGPDPLLMRASEGAIPQSHNGEKASLLKEASSLISAIGHLGERGSARRRPSKDERAENNHMVHSRTDAF